MRNIFHDKRWKEDKSTIIIITEYILGTLLGNFYMVLHISNTFLILNAQTHVFHISGEIWNNPTFMTSISCIEQSEGTYITDVIIPLLHTSIKFGRWCYLLKYCRAQKFSVRLDKYKSGQGCETGWKLSYQQQCTRGRVKSWGQVKEPPFSCTKRYHA